MKYLTSVILGFLGALLIIVLMPIIALMVLVAGFLGQIKVNEKEQL